MRSFIHSGFLKAGFLAALVAMVFSAGASAQNTPLDKQVNSVFPDAQTFYLDLHQHPELSSHETRTAAELAGKLRELG